MDILPSEEEQMIKNVARELLEAEVSTAMVREMELDDLGYPPALWKQMAAHYLPGPDSGGSRTGNGAGPATQHYVGSPDHQH